jgi:predicted esterase
MPKKVVITHRGCGDATRAMAPAAVKARILCLHGYAQNAEFFNSRTGALRKALKALAEFHFVDAPHPATAEFLGDVPEDRGAALGWFNCAEMTPGARPAISAQYVGVEDAFQRLRSACEQHGPFDGVLGFSQGATLAALCCLKPELWWHQAEAPFRFAILFSAFSPRDPRFALDSARASLPSFHCYGKEDKSVLLESSQQVASCFAGAVEHVHEGGHGVPSDATLRAALKDFVRASANAADGPSGSGPGGPGGTRHAGQDGSISSGEITPAASTPAAATRFERDYGAWRQLHGRPRP